MDPAPDARERRVGLACAFSLLLIWAGFLLTGRLSALQGLTPWVAAALRYAGALLSALPLLAVLGRPRLPLGRALALAAFAGFAFPLLAYLGFQHAPAAHAGVMLPGTLPFLSAALGAAFLGEAWTRQRAFSLLLVAGGIGLLALDTFGEHPGAWRGDLLFLGGSAGWAVFTLLLRLWRVTATEATLAVALLPAPLYLPLWWLWLPSTTAGAPVGVLAFHLIYQGAFAVVVAGFLYARAVQALGAPATTTITSVVPALAALAAWPLLGEALGVAGLGGVALVTAGMAFGVARWPASSPRVPSRPPSR